MIYQKFELDLWRFGVSAREEIVAMSCEDLLGSSERLQEAMTQFYAKNEKAANSFTKYVREVLNRLKQFFEKIIGKKSVAEESQLMAKQSAEFISELQKRYDAALLAVKEGNAVRGAQKAEEKVMKQARAESEVITISVDSELAQRIESSSKSKYDVIRDYLIEQFYGQEFTLSDGKTAIMDKRDAQELSHKSDELKTAELSNLKKIIESAMFSHEANNVTHRKFSDFRYYSLTVKFKDQSFDILLNVGKSKYDSKYHIYDITKNRRAANQSPTGLSRSVDNAMKNSSSTDSIPDSSENVNPSDEKTFEQKRIETPGASEVLSELFRDNPNLNGYAEQKKELKSYQELLRSVKVNEQRIAECKF